MIYIYGRHTKTGNEISCGSAYTNWEDVAQRLLTLYNNDKKMNCLGEYYYFAKER